MPASFLVADKVAGFFVVAVVAVVGDEVITN